MKIADVPKAAKLHGIRVTLLGMQDTSDPNARRISVGVAYMLTSIDYPPVKDVVADAVDTLLSLVETELRQLGAEIEVTK